MYCTVGVRVLDVDSRPDLGLEFIPLVFMAYSRILFSYLKKSEEGRRAGKLEMNSNIHSNLNTLRPMSLKCFNLIHPIL